MSQTERKTRRKHREWTTVAERPESVRIVPLAWIVRAMKTLSPRAVRGLMELFAQLRLNRGRSEREWIAISHEDLAFLAAMDVAAVSRVIHELHDKGYITVVERGSGRGHPSRYQMWLPEQWMRHLQDGTYAEQNLADKTWPAKHHFITRLDLAGFRKALRLGKLPARVFLYESWLGGMQPKHAAGHRKRPSWVTPPYRHREGAQLLQEACIAVPRPAPVRVKSDEASEE